MTTLTYIAVTSAGMALIVAVGLLAAHAEEARKEARRVKTWRNGRID